MIVILGMVVLAILATALFVRRYRSAVETVFPPALVAWRVFRFVLLLGIAYAALISGRPSLQLFGIAVVVFGTMYILVEKPQQKIQNNA